MVIPGTPDVSRMLKDIRGNLNLNQAQLAQLLGVTPAAVYLWEGGKRQPEGPAMRLIYALHQRTQQKKPGDTELNEIVKTLAVGAAAVAFIALLETLFSGNKKS